jgi:hypothetical protein
MKRFIRFVIVCFTLMKLAMVYLYFFHGYLENTYTSTSTTLSNKPLLMNNDHNQNGITNQEEIIASAKVLGVRHL